MQAALRTLANEFAREALQEIATEAGLVTMCKLVGCEVAEVRRGRKRSHSRLLHALSLMLMIVVVVDMSTMSADEC